MGGEAADGDDPSALLGKIEQAAEGLGLHPVGGGDDDGVILHGPDDKFAVFGSAELAGEDVVVDIVEVALGFEKGVSEGVV